MTTKKTVPQLQPAVPARHVVTEQQIENAISEQFVGGAKAGFAVRTTVVAAKDRVGGFFFGMLGPKKEKAPKPACGVVAHEMSPQLRAWLGK
jgi:hypothetical protein